MRKTGNRERPLSVRTLVAVMVAGSASLLSRPACAAQSPGSIVAGLLSVGGYFPVDASARNAIGSAKFYSEGQFYVRPAHLGKLRLSGGIETLSATDHIIPFTGDNSFSLAGLSFRLTTARKSHKFRPYFSAGVFAERLQSDRLHFDTTIIAPSAEIGADLVINRWLTLNAGYRIAEGVRGVHPDGFGIYLKLF